MASASVAALHQEGNHLFDAGHYAEAARVFHAAVERFQSDRRSDKDSVDEFVKVAGNLCVCHHAMGDWNTCVATARKLLSIYPIIPKAYAAIGMCIVSRLMQQEAELQHADLINSPNMPPRSGEEVRRDARRYLVKLGGVHCTPDDAHAYLCRAVLLSDAQLQVALGPYLEASVRWISEELLSAGLSLEREYGDGVLGEMSALETVLADVPALLDTAPVLVQRQSVRVLDAARMQAMSSSSGSADAAMQASRGVEELPEAEAQSILRAIRDGQHAATDSGAEHAEAAQPTKPPLEPLDFLLSRQRIAVHVCHAERGGIPRGLTLARATAPFAVGQHVQRPLPRELQPVPLPTDLSGSAAELGAAAAHVDPFAGVTAEESGLVAVACDSPSASAVSMGSLTGASESVPSLVCNACGKEMNPLLLGGVMPTGCATCNSVVYCSVACEAAYRVRHERFECAARQALQARVEALSAMTAAAAASEQPPPQPLPVGEVAPGEAWDALDLHRRVLPLCISVYSGLQCHAAGSAAVRARVLLGAQRRLVNALPAEVATTFAQWRESGAIRALAPDSGCDASEADVQPDTKRSDAGSSGLSASDLMHAIFFMVRLLCDDNPESRSGAFYAERLLLRHSCEPNCVWSESQHSILTSRYICKGEELTMALDDHFPQHWPWQIRQKWFVHHHGVPCQCARCLREGGDLSESRGALSNALVEQLLTADVLGHPCPSPAHHHPTHLFHKQVQRLVQQSKSPQRNLPAVLGRIDVLRTELRKYVLPTHYLLEDLRRAVISIAEPEGHAATTTLEGQGSLLFLEAMWSGAVPAKRRHIRLLPSVFECGRRRRVPPSQQRRRRRTSAVAGAGAASPSPRPSDHESETAMDAGASASRSLQTVGGRGGSGSNNRTTPPPPDSYATGGSGGDDDASKARAADVSAAGRAGTPPPRLMQPPQLVATKDFSAGHHVIDLFYGSYQTWYM